MQVHAHPHATLYISITIDCPFERAYDFLAAPGNFPKWASGLGQSFRHVEGLDWHVETPLGPMTVRFSPRNDYGVLDHQLMPANGEPMVNPMRVIANGAGCDVVFTLFRRTGMTDAEFASDSDWIRKDLAALKQLLESGTL